MSLTNFVPEIWAGDVLQALQKAMVFGSLVNRDYEGLISQLGDTVRITSIAGVTVGDYTKNTDMADPQELTDAQAVMEITQNKYFNFQIDDVDERQGLKVLAAGMNEAAYALKDKADQFVASLYTDASASNLIGDDTTPKVPNNTANDTQNVYNLIVDAGVLLDTSNVPSDGRWMVVPPWFYGRLQKESRFVEADKSGNAAALRTGQVGAIAGFTIFKSNNVPNTTGTKYKILFGTVRAITFADQINKVEQYRLEKRFATGFKGLHLYGAKVVRPACLGVMTCNTT